MALREKKSKRATIAHMQSDSLRTKRRKNRNFRDLETSSRKHRRAANRSVYARTHYGKLGKPGEVMRGTADSFAHIAGGSIKYW